MGILNNSPELLAKRKLLRNNMTKAEVLLWLRLKNKQLRGYKFRRQHSIGNFIVDFYCPELKLVIEVDGSQHNLVKNALRDKIRTAYLNRMNITVIRYWNNEILNNINGVFQDLTYKIKERKKGLKIVISDIKTRQPNR